MMEVQVDTRKDDEQGGPGAARAATGPLLSIGVFARRSWLSPKALRLYDRLGLLPPARIDKENGYRGYRESQLATARLIAMLRRLDIPLTQIAAIVTAPGPQASALIADFWATVEHRIAAQRALAVHLQHSMVGMEGDFSMFEIHEREIAAQTVLTEQRHITVGELSDFIGAAMMRLGNIAAAHGGVTAAPFVIYHGEVNEDSDGPVEVCIPIDPTQATSDAATRREPAHREAYTTITKGQVEFPQILSAYDAVAHWIEAQGKHCTGSPREVYFADFVAAGPNDPVCDIAFPIA
jgi:DNA-binding transcriptional MerR regulator